MRLVSVPRVFGLLLVTLFAVASCTEATRQDDDDDDRGGTWVCSEASPTGGCACDQMRLGRNRAVSDEVEACSQYDCCLFSDETTESTVASCECLPSQDCLAEAASRPGTQVTPVCPPGSDPNGRCAAPDENCRSDYLAERDLTGCCAGTFCRENSAGIPVCQFPSEGELECIDFAEGSEDASLEVVEGTLITSAGTFTLGSVSAQSVLLGPGGCLRNLVMDFTDGPQGSGLIGCGLRLTADVSDFRLVSANAIGAAHECSDFEGEGAAEGMIDEAYVVGLTFTGFNCRRGTDAGPYCLSGSFEWTVAAPTGAVTFEEQRLVAQGQLCSVGTPVSCAD